MEEDEAAFNRLFAAWKMPKSTEVDFDVTKISRAIYKAMLSVKAGSMKEADEVADKVVREVEKETMKQVLEKSRKLTADLRSLMEEDEAAFNRLFAAWKMPKSRLLPPGT